MVMMGQFCDVGWGDGYLEFVVFGFGWNIDVYDYFF